MSDQCSRSCFLLEDMILFGGGVSRRVGQEAVISPARVAQLVRARDS